MLSRPVDASAVERRRNSMLVPNDRCEIRLGVGLLLDGADEAIEA